MGRALVCILIAVVLILRCVRYCALRVVAHHGSGNRGRLLFELLDTASRLLVDLYLVKVYRQLAITLIDYVAPTVLRRAAIAAIVVAMAPAAVRVVYAAL